MVNEAPAAAKDSMKHQKNNNSTFMDSKFNKFLNSLNVFKTRQTVKSGKERKHRSNNKQTGCKEIPVEARA